LRAVIQRVSNAEVRVAGSVAGEIADGFVVLLGVAVGDGEADAEVMAAKIAGLRVFADDEGRMNLDLSEVGGSVLLISQFTLLADLRKGRRPSFVAAADPEDATRLVDVVVRLLRERGLEVAEGEFGAHMEVELVNDGPVTIVIDAVDGSIL
jgi:D-tyrosyl-tRNA(Tyr) deacylase